MKPSKDEEASWVHCPAHDDKQASLKLRRQEKSKWGFVAECTADCTEGDVIAALDKRGLLIKKNRPASDLSVLLYEIAAYLKRYVVFASPQQVIAAVLWVAHTYAIDAAETTPYLAITSSDPVSGKSRLLESFEMLVARPWMTVRPTEAILFRKISIKKSTLLLDEADTIFNKSSTYEGIRAILNAGYRRGAKIERLHGKKIESYDAFGAKALAGLGTIPDTVMSRSIPIPMRRRLRSERAEKFRSRTADHRAAPLRKRLDQWVQGSRDKLRDARPKTPDLLNDRAQDGWEALLAIADEAGGDWPNMARAAAVTLHSKTRVQSVTERILLLQSIRDVFKEKKAKRIFTEDLVKALLKRDDGIWAELWGDLMENDTIPKRSILKGGARIAKLLKGYQIMPKSIRIGGDNEKGYLRANFKDTWKRYLPR